IEEMGEAEPTAAAPVAHPAPAAAPVAAPEGIVVVDVDAAWVSAAGEGAAVTTVSPEGDVAAAVAAKNPERFLINLAAPNALAALVAIRAAGLTTPCFGCLGVAGRQQGILLGRLEVAARPIDPDALLELLPKVFVRGTRVVTAGADVDGLISVRQALG